MTPLQQHELDAAKKAARDFANKSGYGRFISDNQIEALCIEIVNAVDAARFATQTKVFDSGPSRA